MVSLRPCILRGESEAHGLALSRENGHLALIVNEGHLGDNAKITIHSTSMNKVEHQADYVFPGRTEDLCYLNDSGLVACGGDEDPDGYGGEGFLQVFSPSLELVQTLEGHCNCVECVTVSPSFSFIISGDADGKVMIWSASGRERKCLRITRIGFIQCASPPTASSWLLEVMTISSRPTGSTREVPS